MKIKEILDFAFNKGKQDVGESLAKVAKSGLTVSPNLLKDSEFVRASRDSEFYCYITTPDGITHAKTRYEAFRLSQRAERYTAPFKAWLEKQDDPIPVTWEPRLQEDING